MQRVDLSTTACAVKPVRYFININAVHIHVLSQNLANLFAANQDSEFKLRSLTKSPLIRVHGKYVDGMGSNNNSAPMDCKINLVGGTLITDQLKLTYV
jgi:hypothetical protein